MEYIEASSGAVKRVGRCYALATEYDLEKYEYVPIPKGEVHEKKGKAQITEGHVCTDDAASSNNAADMLRVVGAIRSAVSPEIKAQATRIANRLASEDGIGEALRIMKEKVRAGDQPGAASAWSFTN